MRNIVAAGRNERIIMVTVTGQRIRARATVKRAVRRLHTIELIAPNETDAQAQAARELIDAVTALCGGATVTAGKGTWKAPTGRIISEMHWRIEVWCDSLDAVTGAVDAHRRYGRDAGETALARKIDGAPTIETCADFPPAPEWPPAE